MGQFLPVQDVVVDGAQERQGQSLILILQLGPEEAGAVHELEIGVHLHPLLTAGDAGGVAGLGPGFARDAVDKGGFAHVGDAHHHDANGLFDPLRLHALDLVGYGPLHEGYGLLLPGGAGGDDRRGQKATVLVVVHEAAGHSFVGQVRLVEQDQPGLVGEQRIKVRVPGRLRGSGVHDLRHRVHQF